MADAHPTDRRYLRTPIIERVLRSCVEDENGCWLWQRALTRGYGQVSIGGRYSSKLQTHRVTYEYFRAEIPPGLVLDHLCRRTNCTNPWHLDPTTSPENVRRGDTAASGAPNRAKTHCPSGHPYSPENTYSPPRNPQERMCRTCRREHKRRARA